MSYSFTVRAERAADCLFSAVAELDRVIEQQPVHAADRAGAEAAIKGMLGALAATPGEGEEVQVSVHGSVQWRGSLGSEDNPAVVSVANVQVTVSIVTKLAGT
jgi:hypothetical protein